MRKLKEVHKELPDKAKKDIEEINKLNFVYRTQSELE